MGRTKRRFNEKARQSQINETISVQNEDIKVDISVQEDKYDCSNPLVIIGKKKKVSKTSQKELPAPKPLSKKQKKKLANIIAKKKKRINRSELLEKLSKVQAKPQELDYLTSTASMQTHGIKKVIQKNIVTTDNTYSNISNNKGSRKKKYLLPKKKIKLDPNIVNFEYCSDVDDNDTSDESTIDDIDSCSTQVLQTGLGPSSSVEITKSNNPLDDAHSKEKADLETSSSVEVTKSNNPLDDALSKEKNTTFDHKPNLENSTINVHEQILPAKVPAVFICVNRLPEIQSAREALPIFCEEQSIMEAVRENAVVVIHGETGSGKTTQVPQFLYEGGYTQNNKMIGITEPRRIAAMTMATRVGIEMNLPDVVAYHVRYENNVKEGTQIKFMTDGVLLKEIRQDFLLSRYSVIIIDEAHERSVFSDVLIGLLSRILLLRDKRSDPLKLIIMSATIRVQDFMENPRLFKEPPFLIRLDSRQYKVQVHFNIHTPSDYVQAAYNKVCKIHTQLPTGAILVFLTGEKEVTTLCKMLRNTYPFEDDSKYNTQKLEIKKPNSDISINFKQRKNKKRENTSFCSLPSKINLDDYSAEPLDVESMEHQLSDEDDSPVQILNYKQQENLMPLYTLPLYSVLPFAEQDKVFKPPPTGSRLCVISTNVAETSITIPGLKYVVDSGKVKTKMYDTFGCGISQFCIVWASKASANQRAGRAGRTEGGHCYRLYSSSVFEHEFPDFSIPELQRIPVDDILLQMKALGIDRVVNFPFPSPPDKEALKNAEKRLVLLGALQDLNKGERYKDIKKWEYSAKITPLGKAMSRFPVSPRYAKMLILSYKHEVIPYIVSIVSAMTVPEIFINTNGNVNDNSEQKGIRKFNSGLSKEIELGDAMVLLRIVALFEESKNKVQFCCRNGIRHKAMTEIHKMCLQLYREMNRAFRDLSLSLEEKFEPPSEEQIQKLQKIMTTGFTDHVARLYSEEEMKINKELKNAYKCLDLETSVYIHPSSSLFSKLPQYIIYQEIIHTSKYYMKGVVEINPEWLPAFAPNLCNFSEPLEEPPPSYDQVKDNILCTMNVKFGPWQWELPPATLEMPKGLLKYSWFSFFLLDGQVYDFFKFYRKHLLSSPTTVLKSWAKLLPRTRYLLQALIVKEVDSRESLRKAWEKDSKFLLREYWEWLPNEKHMEIECKWPPK